MLASLGPDFAAADPDDAGLKQCTRRAAKLVETLQALLEAGSDSGLRWVEVDYDQLRGMAPDELRLF